MSFNDDLGRIEEDSHVNIDVSDESGCTHVYTYTDDDIRLAFEFVTMNPSVEDVRAVAHAIDTLRGVMNKRPRVGRPDMDQRPTSPRSQADGPL